MNAAATETSKSGMAGGENRPTGRTYLIAAALVPILIVGNAILVLLIPWHADLQYAAPGFPDPPAVFAEGERTELGRKGIVSIWPVGPGVGSLEAARLERGGPAFESDEVDHMADVRQVVSGYGILWLLALLGFLIFRRTLDRGAVRLALATGAWLTLALFLLVGLFSLVSFDAFFTSFHEAFFEDGTWTFPLDSTLIGLYPERFWVTATALLVALSVIQALVIIWWTIRSRMPR